MDNAENRKILANVSNRHVHLSSSDLEILFGKGYKLTKLKDLMQPGEHSCQETVTIVGKKRQLENVRILGPVRSATQVEISVTDSINLGIDAPLRISGNIAGSAPLKIIGPKGEIDLKEGCIIAKRHVHMTTTDAKRLGVSNNQVIKIKCPGDRGLIFDNVVSRVSDKMSLECHLDTDEANSAGLKNGDSVYIL
ncbi:MAG: phosphate propanoyltransferase [Elusimicrobia bacterium]|nr:phosphate propanoyltransferase [Elusimicrobiota bacterium]